MMVWSCIPFTWFTAVFHHFYLNDSPNEFNKWLHCVLQIFRSIDAGSVSGFPATVQEVQKRVNNHIGRRSYYCLYSVLVIIRISPFFNTSKGWVFDGVFVFDAMWVYIQCKNLHT